MTVLTKPNDIARETLRLLVTRRETPTPENYRRLYSEIAGQADDDSQVTTEKFLRRLSAEMPRGTSELVMLGNTLASAATTQNWERAHHALLEFTRQRYTGGLSTSELSALIRELAKLLVEHHTNLKLPDKLAALEKALAGGGELATLSARLVALANTWAQLPVVLTSVDTQVCTGQLQPGVACQRENLALQSATELRELLAQTLDSGIAARLLDAPALAAHAHELAGVLRSPGHADAGGLRAQLNTLWREIESHGNVRDQIQAGLLELLRLLIQNIGELVADDQWLRGQIAIVLQVISSPLDLELIVEAQNNLKDVILRQGLLKQSLNETKTTLKQMLAAFIDELGKLSTATGDYHDSIESLAQQIRQTEDVNELNVLLEEVLRETRNVQASALRSREEVLKAREEVDAAELKIRKLENELDEISEKVRLDHLTGTLNRRGLNNAFERELSLAQRNETPLCIALLDIDNFKDLNDNFGHQAGDDALVHLSQVIKDTMRPSDTISRYGGEEFLILLPDTDTAQAVTIMGRLQRALTKRFFLHDNRKVLITFSAGVAVLSRGDDQASVITRADRALYQAKRAGKNRVVAAPPLMDKPSPAPVTTPALQTPATVLT